MAPLTGVPLPFVSYGNSSLMVDPVRGRADPQRRPRRHRQGGAGPRPPALANCASSKAGARPPRKEPSERCQESQGSWWQRGEPRVTWCPPWRSPPSFGLAAPRSPSSARGRRSRRSWSPPPATRSTSSRCAGSTAATRCAPPGPASRRWARSPPRGAALRRRGADVVMGGGGYVAGPAGLAAIPDRDAAGPDRGRQPPRPRQPPARPPRPPRLPRLPDRGARGRALPGHRPAGAAGDLRSRPRRRAGALRDRRPRPAACSWSAAARAPARSTSPPLEAFAERDGRDFDVLHLSGRRDHDELRAPPRRRAHTATRYTLLELRAATSATSSPPPTSSSAAPAARSSRSTAAGRPAILVPYPHATGDHQSANADWMERAGAATVIADDELERRAGCCEARSRRSSATPGGWRRWRRPRAASPGPTRRGGSPTRSWRRRDDDSSAAPTEWASVGCTSSASAAPG